MIKTEEFGRERNAPVRLLECEFDELLFDEAYLLFKHKAGPRIGEVGLRRAAQCDDLDGIGVNRRRVVGRGHGLIYDLTQTSEVVAEKQAVHGLDGLVGEGHLLAVTRPRGEYEIFGSLSGRRRPAFG